MENNSNQIIFKAILQIVGAFLFLLILFIPAYALIKYAPWTLVIIIPIFLVVYSAGVYSSIEEMYKALVDRRQKEIKERYPHAYTWRDSSGKTIKEQKAFLHIPDDDWARKEERILQNIKEKELNDKRIKEAFSALEKEAPHGIDLWLKKNHFVADWKNPIPLEDLYSGADLKGLLDRVNEKDAVCNKDVIYELEHTYQRFEEDKEWVKEQKAFSHSVWELIGGVLKGMGCFAYSAPVSLFNEEGGVFESSQKFRQIFFHSYCLDDQRDYTFFPEKVQLKNYLNGDSSAWGPLNNRIYHDMLKNALKKLREKYEDLAVIVYNDNLIAQFIDGLIGNKENSNGVTLITEQDKLYVDMTIPLKTILLYENIPLFYFSDLSNSDLHHKKIIVITNRTETSEIINFTKQLWRNYPTSRPCVSFLSLFKELSTEEMQALIDEKNKAIAEEEEKKRKEQELIDSIQSKVKGWEPLSPFSEFKIKYLLDYYPTTVEFDADDDEWDDRWTVWNFKNDPEKTPEKAHQRVLDRVIPEFAGILKDTFGEESLKYLTLVCIPASTQIKNDARYKEFSERLCQETGMENGFDYTHVTVSREARHNGGEEGVVNYSFDDSFFNGKRVILLDDIITKGNSMRIAKAKLEKLGAQVICGLSVGKTRHERRNGHPDMDEE